MRWTLLALALATACYSPSISECTIRCGASNSCPSGTSCLADNFCHADLASSCKPLGDGGFGVLDARPVDARTGDARVADARTGDARTGDGPIDHPDGATKPDAPFPDAGPCVDTVTTLDSDGNLLLSNLTIGIENVVNISYIDSDAGQMYFLRGGAGGFAPREPVTTAASYLKGQISDVVGGVHVVYTDGKIGSLRLRYAHRGPGGDWSEETITEANSPMDGTIALEANGTPHVAYYAQDIGQLWHGRRVSGHWTNEVIDNGGDNDVGEYPSMATMPTGGFVVTYYDVTGRQLKVATQGASGWNNRVLDSSGSDVGAYTALAIDATGRLHVAYADAANNTLKYLEATGNGQATRVVADDTDSVGRYNAIALDRSGGVHISTDAFGQNDLHYVQRLAGASGFTVKDLDSPGSVGRHTSIGVDTTGAVHISYIDSTNHSLKYAVICPR